MEAKYIIKAIHKLKPNAEFSFIEDDYSTIKWDVLDGDAPSILDIEETINKIKDEEMLAQNKAAIAKAALLEKLGITEDEAKLLLS